MSGLTTNYNAKKPMTVKGTVVNAEPGFPAPSGATVNVQQIVGGQPLTVASGKTNSTGAYSIKFTPSSTGSYQVSTGQISQIEIPTLNPAYGDILSPASTTAVNVTVHSKLTKLSVKSQGGRALLVGSVAPGTGHANATVTFLARKAGSHGALSEGHRRPPRRQRRQLRRGAAARRSTSKGWQVKVKFQDGKQVLGTTSAAKQGDGQAKACRRARSWARSRSQAGT